MTSNPLLQSNPMLASWMQAAQSLAAPWGALWTGELARRQMEALAEFNRQALRAWTGAFAFAPAAAAQPAEAAEPAAAQPAEAAPSVQVADLAEAVPLPAAPAAEEPPVPASVAPALPEPRAAAPASGRRGKSAAPLRAPVARRKAAPVGNGPRRGPAKPKGVTRH